MHRICSLLIGTIAIAGIARAGDHPAAAAAAVDPYLWLEDKVRTLWCLLL